MIVSREPCVGKQKREMEEFDYSKCNGKCQIGCPGIVNAPKLPEIKPRL